MLVQGGWGNWLGGRALGKAGSPAGDVVGHAELEVGLAQGRHDPVVPARSKKEIEVGRI